MRAISCPRRPVAWMALVDRPLGRGDRWMSAENATSRARLRCGLGCPTCTRQKNLGGVTSGRNNPARAESTHAR
jgi:hypothetical protein